VRLSSLDWNARPWARPLTSLRALLLGVLVSGWVATRGEIVVFPAGTSVAIRFVRPLYSGRDGVGTQVLVQTLDSLVIDRCVVVPAYRRVAGRVVISKAGRIFGGRGTLRLRFDSLEVAPQVWVPFDAVLETLEYTSAKNLTDSGVVYGAHASLAGRAVPVGVVSAADLGLVPAAVLGGYWLARRGPAARIVPGELGALRLLAPFRITMDAPCAMPPVAAVAETLPDLPSFSPWSEPKSGRGAGDPLNVLFLGTAGGLDSAFRRAGWVGPARGSIRTVTSEIVAGIANRPAVGAPLSTQYFAGRRQDLAYQLAGPTARSRHHVRLWQLDSLAGAWVGAANEDVGVEVNPFKGRFTHRIDPAIDGERDRIVKELEAAGCAELVRYTTVPGAVTAGRNAKGQPFVTDARTAVVLVHSCAAPRTLANRP
jgi:hypothetical protein